MGKRVIAFLCCLALLFGVGGTANVQAKSAKASKTVYVITKQSFKTGEFSGANTYSYNKRGLIKKSVRYMDGEKYGYSTYIYNSKKKGRLMEIEGAVIKGDVGKSKTTYVYTSKGKIKQIKSSRHGTYVVKKRKNGKATLIVNNALDTKYSISYNKKGHVKKITAKEKFDGNDVTNLYTYSYDKKGNVAKDPSEKYKNTYKNGRLVKSSAVGTKKIAKYTYKKIKVPAKYYKRVKKQQWDLRNEIEFPVDGLEMVQ